MSINPPLPTECDVAIIGAGPAGLAAATELRALGIASVIVLDREAEAGGIPRHCGHYPFGMREFHRLMRGPDLARRLVERALAAGVEIFTDVTVVSLQQGPQVLISSAQGLGTLAAKRVIIATGVRETSRAGRFIGGTKPGGVLSTGALQGLVYLEGRKPFDRPVIIGSELVAFSALLTCRHAGIRPQAMIEGGRRPTAWSFAPILPKVMGVPMHFNSSVTAISGRSRVEAVTMETPQGVKTIQADGVIVSGRFCPEASLLAGSPLEVDAATGGPVVDQFGRCQALGYFAAGNLLRPVETAGWSWREGQVVGRLVAQDLVGALPQDQAISIRCASPDLRYVMPQRIIPGAAKSVLPGLQVRVVQQVQGTICMVDVTDGERLLWQRSLKALPERRILLPLAPLDRAAKGGHVEIRLHRGGQG